MVFPKSDVKTALMQRVNNNYSIDTTCLTPELRLENSKSDSMKCEQKSVCYSLIRKSIIIIQSRKEGYHKKVFNI